MTPEDVIVRMSRLRVPLAHVAAHLAMHDRISIAAAARIVADLTGERVMAAAAVAAWRKLYPGRRPFDRELRPRSSNSQSAKAVEWIEANGGSLTDGALRFGVTAQSVSRRWHRVHGDTPTPLGQRSARVRVEVVELLRRGMSLRTAARVVGTSHSTAERFAKAAGVSTVEIAAQRRAEVRQRIVAELAAGATLQDAGINAGVSRRLATCLAAEAGVRPAARSSRRDGCMARAVALVHGGMSVVAACRSERCSETGVYIRTRELRQR